MKRSDSTQPRTTKSCRIMEHDLTLSDRATTGRVTYVARDDETGLVTSQITLLATDVASFGEPTTITVTIEPGDRLNP